MDRQEEEKSLEEEFFRLHPKVRKVRPEQVQRELRQEEKRKRFNVILRKELSVKRQTSTGWCKCGHCKTKACDQPVQCFCCMELLKSTTTAAARYNEKWPSKDACLALDDTIQTIVKPEMVRIAALTHFFASKYADVPKTFSNRTYRYFAYRSLCLHVHGSMKSGLRLPFPACIVDLVRNMYPGEVDEGDEYMGFEYGFFTDESEESDTD